MKRICIYPKDIARITGKSYRQSLRIHHTIKKLNGKQRHQVVTVEELCAYLGVEQERVKDVI